VSEETPKLPKRISVHYRETPDHRILHADGAWASITPQLEIQMAFYHLLMPLPTEASHVVTPEGTIGPIVEEQREFAIERRSDATVVVNPIVAVQIIQLLQGLVNHIKATSNEQVKESIEQAEASKS